MQTDLMIMDFAKAFDKVPHKRLLYKMKYLGISEQIINWVKSFLSNRTQTVLLENITSSKIPVTFDVPQGTVLGPIFLFLSSGMDRRSFMSAHSCILRQDSGKNIIYTRTH